MSQLAGDVERYDYTPFGEVIPIQINPQVHYRFTGQELDEFSNGFSLHNFRARMYDSDIGRFYAIDPSGEGNSPYAYVANNPIMFVDPTGRRRADAWCLGCYNNDIDQDGVDEDEAEDDEAKKKAKAKAVDLRFRALEAGISLAGLPSVEQMTKSILEKRQMKQKSLEGWNLSTGLSLSTPLGNKPGFAASLSDNVATLSGVASLALFVTGAITGTEPLLWPKASELAMVSLYSSTAGLAIRYAEGAENRELQKRSAGVVLGWFTVGALAATERIAVQNAQAVTDFTKYSFMSGREARELANTYGNALDFTTGLSSGITDLISPYDSAINRPPVVSFPVYYAVPATVYQGQNVSRHSRER